MDCHFRNVQGMVYGDSRNEGVSRVGALDLGVLADRLENGVAHARAKNRQAQEGMIRNVE